jgi:SAM-dependent methyltransferase
MRLADWSGMHERIVEMDWDERYVSGNLPWDSGHPSTELRRVVEETNELPGSGRLLELGCGSGTNAVYLARHGFDVTAVDGSREAIARAQARLAAETIGDGPLPVAFHVGDVTALSAGLGEGDAAPFDVLFDRGCYHCVRLGNLAGFQAMLERVTRPGTLFLLLAGNAKESREGQGPPTVSEEDLRTELGGMFEFLRISEFQFDDTGNGFRPLAWSVLMRRR